MAFCHYLALNPMDEESLHTQLDKFVALIVSELPSEKEVHKQAQDWPSNWNEVCQK